MALELNPSRRRFLRRAAWGTLASIVGVGSYARWVEPHWIDLVERDLSIAHLPETLQGRRLVQISDLHVGDLVDDDYLLGAFQRVADLQPDILAITGDFMTCGADEHLDHVSKVVRHLRPGRLATLAILGNHDYAHQWSNVAVADGLAARLTDAGIDVLRDRTTVVQGLQITGIDDLLSPCFEGRTVLRNLDLRQAALVLCHNPDAVDLPIWSGYRGWILSGHTHGGQCRIPFGPAPILPVNNRNYVSGAIDLQDGRHLYINRALGYVKRCRFNARPEITVFTLRREAETSPAS